MVGFAYRDLGVGHTSTFHHCGFSAWITPLRSWQDITIRRHAMPLALQGGAPNPDAPWCWYSYLQNWLIKMGQMLVSIPYMEHMGKIAKLVNITPITMVFVGDISIVNVFITNL